MKQIIVNISPAGSVNVDAQGFKGKGCAEATEQIEVAIGGPLAAAKRKKKPDFFCVPGSTAQTVKRTF